MKPKKQERAQWIEAETKHAETDEEDEVTEQEEEEGGSGSD